MNAPNQCLQNELRGFHLRTYSLARIFALIALLFCVSASELLAQQVMQPHVFVHRTSSQLTSLPKDNLKMTTRMNSKSQAHELRYHNHNGAGQKTDNSRHVSDQFSVYLELFGNGAEWSINLDYKFANNLTVRLGFTDWSTEGFLSSETHVTAVPVMVNYLIGESLPPLPQNHWLEIGVGIVLNKTTESSDFTLNFLEPPQRFISEEIFTHPYYTATLGYRYQRPNGGLLFRIGLTPRFNYGMNKESVFSIGISFGFSSS